MPCSWWVWFFRLPNTRSVTPRQLVPTVLLCEDKFSFSFPRWFSGCWKHHLCTLLPKPPHHHCCGLCSGSPSALRFGAADSWGGWGWGIHSAWVPTLPMRAAISPLLQVEDWTWAPISPTLSNSDYRLPLWSQNAWVQILLPSSPNYGFVQINN